MRTDCSVDQTEVVALVLEDVASAISSPCIEVKMAIEREGSGWTKRLSKDFLSADATALRICRGVNSRKRKCCAVKLCALPQHIQAEIKSGK